MELGHGTKWGAEISLACASMVTIIVYKLGMSIENFYILFGIFFISFITFPGLLRFILCWNWKEYNAKVISQKDVSKPAGSWRGIDMYYCYEAEIVFVVHQEEIKAKIDSGVPFKDEVRIYFNPEKPTHFTRTKSLGIKGWCFLLILMGIPIIINLFKNT